jgi:hypothetical protein
MKSTIPLDSPPFGPSKDTNCHFLPPFDEYDINHFVIIFAHCPVLLAFFPGLKIFFFYIQAGLPNVCG